MRFFDSIQQKLTKLYFKLKPLFSNKKFLIISFLVSFGLLLPKISQAGVWGLGKIIGGLLYIYIQFMYGLTANVIAPILGWAVKGTNGFLQNDVITEGWTVIRDTANMFFILILLFIAFATILRVEQFTYRKMLVPMIIAILMVNFSRTICGIYVEFADTLMNGFIGGLKGGAENIPIALLRGANLDTLLKVSEEALDKLKTTWSDVTNLMFIAAYVTVFTVAIIGVSIFLVVRTLGLALLMITSPLAFVLPVVPIPAIKRWHEEWWKMFTQLTLYGPIAVFCIMLAAKLSSSVLEIQTDPNKVGFLTPVSTPTKTLEGLLVIGILFGAIFSAKALGMAGASAIISGAKRAGTFAPRQAGKWLEGALAAGRKGLPGRMITAAGAALAGTRGGAAFERWRKTRAVPAVKRAVTPLARFTNRVRDTFAPPEIEEAAETSREKLAKDPKSKSASWLMSRLSKQVDEKKPRHEIAGTILRMLQVSGGAEALREGIGTNDILRGKVAENLKGQKSDEAVDSFTNNVFGDRADAAKNLFGEVSKETGNYSFSHFGGRDETTGEAISLDSKTRAKKMVADLERTNPEDRWRVSPDIILDVNVVRELKDKAAFRKNIETTAPMLSARLEDAISKLPPEERAAPAAGPAGPTGPIVTPSSGARKTPEEIKEAGKIREARGETRGRIEERKKAGMREKEGMPSE